MATIKFLVAATCVVGALGAFSVRAWRSFCGMAHAKICFTFLATCTDGFP